MGSPDTNREDDFEALFPRAVTYRALRDADPAHALREMPSGKHPRAVLSFLTASATCKASGMTPPGVPTP
jgi:hypothetical protein